MCVFIDFLFYAKLLFLSHFSHILVLRPTNEFIFKAQKSRNVIKNPHTHNIFLPPIRLYSSHSNATCSASRSLSLCHQTFYLQLQLLQKPPLPLPLPGDATAAGGRRRAHLSVYRTTLGGCAAGYTGTVEYFTLLVMFPSLRLRCVCFSPLSSHLFVYLVQDEAMRQVALELREQLNQHWGASGHRKRRKSLQ